MKRKMGDNKPPFIEDSPIPTSPKKYDTNISKPKQLYRSRLDILRETDPEFRAKHEHWLSNATAILQEILDKIREKIKEPNITMADLTKALDTIAEQYNLSEGRPSSITGHLHAHKLLDESELDRRIAGLRKELNYREVDVTPVLIEENNKKEGEIEEE